HRIPWCSTSFANPTTASYGGLMSQGYVPPGQFEDLLNLIRQASAASERAMNAAKYAEMAASAAGAAGQQAVVRAMHMANAPGAPTAAPFSPGAPDPGVGIGVASMPWGACFFSSLGGLQPNQSERTRLKRDNRFLATA
ncbi:Ppp1r7, partial [Symbiodinium sp. KB8]